MFTYGITPAEERKQRERAQHDAEVARIAMHDAYNRELRGLEGRLAGVAAEITAVDASLENAGPAWRGPLEAERDALLRVAENLDGRLGLVRIEIARCER
jgi:hypothetical protein